MRTLTCTDASNVMVRSVLKPAELSGSFTSSQRGTGKPSNSGWQLDRWKFLPMLNRTLYERPSEKWYVFVETDTSIFWSKVLGYLGALDWTHPYYLGAQVWMGDVIFAHGGSGSVLSRPALEKVVSMFSSKKEEWERYTDQIWAGDIILGNAMSDAGAPLVHAWPIWQGDDIGNMNWNEMNRGRRLWYHPTISYHHLTPGTVTDMWRFEQEWIATHLDVSTLSCDHSWKLALTILDRATSSGTKTCTLTTFSLESSSRRRIGTITARATMVLSLPLKLVALFAKEMKRVCSTHGVLI